MDWLRREHPDRVAGYERIYGRGTYASASIRRGCGRGGRSWRSAGSPTRATALGQTGPGSQGRVADAGRRGGYPTGSLLGGADVIDPTVAAAPPVPRTRRSSGGLLPSAECGAVHATRRAEAWRTPHSAESEGLSQPAAPESRPSRPAPSP